jgi:hypothetical protein
VLLENEECGVAYQPISLDLTPVYLFVSCALKNVVYTSKPRALQDLRRETETARAAITLATIRNVCQSVVDICDVKCENIIILPLLICEL